MPSGSAIKEYLFKLTPSIDKSKWKKSTQYIGNLLNKNQQEYNKILEKQKTEQKKLLELENKRTELTKIRDALASKQTALGGAGKDLAVDSALESYDTLLETNAQSIAVAEVKLDVFGEDLKNAGSLVKSNFAGGLINSIEGIPAVIDLFKESIEKTTEILDKTSEVGNKFISSSSIFVDEDIKSTMARYGVGSTTAQSIVAAQEALGISESDYATMTEGQKEAFNDLMQHYQEGLDSIDPDKLERFNEATQEYQLMLTKFQMDLELAFTKILAESDILPKLIDTFSEFLESVVDLLSSDTAQFVFDTFLSFLNTIIKVLSVPLKLFSGGGGSTTNNTTTNNTTNNYYTSSVGSNPLYLQNAKSVIH